MNVKSILVEAAAALKFNRHRSLLTVASLAWGVACFVILYSYGEGFGFALRTSFQAVGQDLVLMFGGQTSTQVGGERSGRVIKLETADSQLIRDNVPLVAAVSSELQIQDSDTVANNPPLVKAVPKRKPAPEPIAEPLAVVEAPPTPAPEMPARASVAPAAGTSRKPEPAEPLLVALRDWRRNLARAAGVPAYIIFPDTTLRAVAETRPATRDALRALPGIGPVKLERHGTQVLELVRAHA